MRTLVQIIDELGLDNRTNHTHGTDKEVHKYCSTFYDKEFAKYQDKDIRLLEIGIFRGGSLILWREYFSQAKIVGVDVIDFGSINNTNNLKDVMVYIQNALTENFSKFLGKFDIIIDDGEHTFESQIQSLKLYVPQLNSGGVFVIEDIQDYEYTKEFITLVPDDCTFEIVDSREIAGFKDNIMFIVRKN
jgi:cephalosporin hydroxylase